MLKGIIIKMNWTYSKPKTVGAYWFKRGDSDPILIKLFESNNVLRGWRRPASFFDKGRWQRAIMSNETGNPRYLSPSLPLY
jgi:hypothetical protein